MNPSRRSLLSWSAATGLVSLGLPARADYPDRPVRLIVPYSPGGPASLLARYLCERLQANTRQAFVVENKPGAGLAVGAQTVAGSPPDGYTLLVNASSMYVPSSLASRTPQDNLRDFAPISLVGGFPLVMVCNAKLGVRSVKDVIELARREPGKLNYGSSGTGSLTHLAAAMFARMADIELTHVPYRGISEALFDVAAGRVQFAFGGLPTTLPLASKFGIQPLAVTSATRTSAAPELPTVAESGLAGYEVDPWYGIVAPRGTPAAVVARLHRELTAIMKSQAVQEQWKAWGADALFSPQPESFARVMQQDTARWSEFLKTSGIKVE